MVSSPAKSDFESIVVRLGNPSFEKNIMEIVTRLLVCIDLAVRAAPPPAEPVMALQKVKICIAPNLLESNED